MELYIENMTEVEGRTNFILTLFFILAPITLLSCWNVYVHIAREDILPLFREMSETNRRLLRNFLYFILCMSPFGPIFSFSENCFVQMKCIEISSSADAEHVSICDKISFGARREAAQKVYVIIAYVEQ